MRRKPYFSEPAIERVGSSETFDPKKWLTTEETAIYLGKLTKTGMPSVGAIRNMVYRGQLIPYKPFGRLLFKRAELDHKVESSKGREKHGN